MEKACSSEPLPLKLMHATVVVLCRNNPSELEETLHSLKGATDGLGPNYQLELLVIDGSNSNACSKVYHSIILLNWNCRFIHRFPNGTYDAMNIALGEVKGRWIAFMNSGDIYLRGGFATLLLYAESQSVKRSFKHLGAVFGQAWIEPPGLPLRWLTPNPRLDDIDVWLRHMVPCHQSMLFQTTFAKSNPYHLRAGSKADRAVIKASLTPPAEISYLSKPVCVFRLNGQSSRLFDWHSITSPGLAYNERLVEMIKIIISPFATVYPFFMWMRSIWFGWIC